MARPFRPALRHERTDRRFDRIAGVRAPGAWYSASVLLVFELPEDQIESGTLLVAETTVAPLAEQVEIAMHAVLPENRHESITLARGGRIMPWMLEF